MTEFPDITVFDMRLRDIEKELKTINLNYENLYFEIDKIKNSFEELSLKLNTFIINKETQVDNRAISLSDNQDSPIDNQDGSIADNSLGTLKINSKDLSNLNDDDEIIDLQDKDVNLSTNINPDEQFQIAFGFLRSQKFENAEVLLKKFILDYPDNDLSGSAYYWLGEIYLLKKENRDAALTFAEGYQKFSQSVKAPDSLYKLAEVLLKIDKKNEACDTFNQFIIKFTLVVIKCG